MRVFAYRKNTIFLRRSVQRGKGGKATAEGRMEARLAYYTKQSIQYFSLRQSVFSWGNTKSEFEFFIEKSLIGVSHSKGNTLDGIVRRL